MYKRQGVYGDTDEFRRAWRDAFSTSTAEVNTVEDRNDRVSERLNEVAAVLLLIAVATLLVGGLGVAMVLLHGCILGERISLPCQPSVHVMPGVLVSWS